MWVNATFQSQCMSALLCVCSNDISSGVRASAQMLADTQDSFKQGGLLLGSSVNSIILPELRRRSPAVRGKILSPTIARVTELRALSLSFYFSCAHACNACLFLASLHAALLQWACMPCSILGGPATGDIADALQHVGHGTDGNVCCAYNAPHACQSG